MGQIPTKHKFILVAAFVILISAGILSIQTIYEYKEAQQEYKELRDFSESVHKEKNFENIENIGNIGYNEEELQVPEDKPILADVPDFEIDLEQLRSKNQEFVAWLYIGAIDIGYPVVQGEDNEYYLNHTFERQENASGCIFLDYRQKPDFTSYNTFVYGHNMKDQSMFGSIKRFLYDEKLIGQDPYFYLYTRQGILRYQIYAYYQDTPESKSFWTCNTKQEYEKYVPATVKKSVNQEWSAQIMEELKNNKESSDNKEVEYPKSVVLVTCVGSGASKQRIFMHGFLVDEYQNKTDTLN